MDSRPIYIFILNLLHFSFEFHQSDHNTAERNNHPLIQRQPLKSHHKRFSHRDSLYTNPEHGFCRSNNDCPIGKNLTCLFVYEGCGRGVCTCNPSTSTMKNNRCVPISFGGQTCSSISPACASSFHCVGGICRCPRNHFMTEDKTRCLKDGTKLLGQPCDPPLQAHNHQRCYRKLGDSYTFNDVVCSMITSRCECVEGFKRHQHSCVTRKIGESGCITSMHCGGGAVCDDGQCVCPTGYRADQVRHKCVRKGAIVNLEVGERCDEVNEKSYCSPGLVCYRCSSREDDKCIKFLLTDHYGNTAGSMKREMFIFILSFLISTILMKNT